MRRYSSTPLAARLIAVAIALALAPAAQAQHAGHEGHVMPPPAKAEKKPVPKKPAAKPVPAKPSPAAKPAAVVDHAAMGHGAPPPPTRTPTKPAAKPAPVRKPAPKAQAAQPVDHAAMGHGTQAAPAPAAAKPAKPPAPGTRPAATGVDHAAMGHGAHPRPAPKPAPPKKPVAAPAGAAQAVDHAAMGHRAEAPQAALAAQPKSGSDHAGMDHGASEAMDHSAMGHDAPTPATPDTPAATGHEGMDHGAMGHGPGQAVDHAAMGHAPNGDLPADAEPRTPIPEITEADLLAAVPPMHAGHETHDTAIHSYWLADRLEWQDTEEGSLAWEGVAWIGTDINRVWLRTEGEASGGEIESGDLEVLYGRAVDPWWDVVAGVRQDFGEGPSRTYAAFGVQGLAPYKFEVEATAYVGSGGRTAATVEAEYDTLITNRLILQWQAEASLHGKDDPERGIGSGLSTVEAGARLRYEITRRFAPYVGVEFERAFGGTADLRREHGEPVRDTRLVAGIRFWF